MQYAKIVDNRKHNNGEYISENKNHWWIGYHTVTQDMDLIYTEEEKNIINRKTKDKIVTIFIKREGWNPLGIHSTKFNGDILVRIITDFVAKVTRYNKSGKEI